jgi:hypothetical protein
MRACTKHIGGTYVDVIERSMLQEARFVGGYEHGRRPMVEDGGEVVEPVKEIDVERAALVGIAMQMRHYVMLLAGRQAALCSKRNALSAQRTGQ